MAAMMKRIIVDGRQYRVTIRGKFVGDSYKYRIQAIPMKGWPFPLRSALSEEFLEDELKNTRDVDYLDRLTMRVAENHLQDIIPNYLRVIQSEINRWFIEAIEELDNEKKK